MAKWIASASPDCDPQEDDLDERASHKVAVLGATVLSALLGGASAENQTIKVRGEPRAGAGLEPVGGALLVGTPTAASTPGAARRHGDEPHGCGFRRDRRKPQ